MPIEGYASTPYRVISSHERKISAVPPKTHVGATEKSNDIALSPPHAFVRPPCDHKITARFELSGRAVRMRPAAA